METFTIAMMRACGLEVTGHGETQTSTDLQLGDGTQFSVKSQFTKNRGKIKLINTQGKQEANWSAATIFVIAGIGIVYGDPDMVDPRHVKVSSDAVELSFSGIRKLMEEDSWLIPLEIPYKQNTQNVRHSKKASAAVVEEILNSKKFNVLGNFISDK